ncbi:Receptor-type guanylate cyclase gcy [Seminavis robusta]|uniref:Receptor-type guanylate cyclase gcy n=1 Tax=Seminavis robusta TaxID=568900 RepID=A0A9N8E5G9_9STRA|nr:Receptor-type guanylate cyclase gcy [Seminavis robusta]|eukprot:Sro519_g159060.1 Receptor-type guanylate cyclase gcy (1185) ;mRNA; f:57197-61187
MTTLRMMDVRSNSNTPQAQVHTPLLLSSSKPKRHNSPTPPSRQGSMKRIRRRTKRNDSGLSMRRSISHPPSRRESFIPKVKKALQPLLGGSSKTKDRNKNTTATTGSASASSSSSNSDSDIDNSTTDLEAGCPTSEGPRCASLLHKKNDDHPAQFTTTRRSTNTTTKCPTNCYYWAADPWLRCRHDWTEFWHVLPLMVKVSVGVHFLTCLYCVTSLYHYQTSLIGSLGALFVTTLVASALVTSSLVAAAAFRTAHLEWMEMMDQQIKSRAILTSLYPTRVLEQMYLDITPEQLALAQEQIQSHLDQTLATSSSSSLLHHATGDDPTGQQSQREMSDESIMFHQEQEQEKLLQERQFRKESFHNSVNSLVDNVHDSSRSLLSLDRNTNTTTNNWGDTTLHTSNNNNNNNHLSSRSGRSTPAHSDDEDDDGDDEPVNSVKKTTVDRTSLGYGDDEPPKLMAPPLAARPPPSPRHHHTDTCPTTSTTTSTNTEMICIRRNSLTLRRKSMTRRATMGIQPRRTSSSFRRRSSVGSTKSVSSNASSATTGRPIQERFDPTTVLFADIAGFTQWCSEREPCHVFTLLEAVFFVFDNLAKQLSVYKIETIGDCYVAVTGIPDLLDDHCVAMALFASQIILEFDQVVEGLATEDGLGLDTALLRLRVGCHSGPVTAGVLRGDKGRFQLFGDTVNTAARMESNGQPGRVQISAQMAHVLALDGKSHWYTPRPDKITAKGKGELQTYWLQDDLMGQYKRDRENKVQLQRSLWTNLEDVTNLQQQQLIDWNIQQLEILVKKIVAINTAHQMDASRDDQMDDWGGPLHYEEPDGTILDELKMTTNNSGNLIPISKNTNVNYESVVLSPKVATELRDFVKAIAANFQNNPFHNFQHSCHTIRSILQVMTELEKSSSSASNNNNSGSNNTGGKPATVLSRDPLAQFVLVLTCMVQDVDNPGVTNEQLMKEDSDMAEYFNNTCLQQQNALDVAWELLVGETCENLLLAICSHSAMELDRFRKYMVHAMMATDLEDRDLMLARYKRWNEVSNPHHSTNRRNSLSSSPPTWLQSIVCIEQAMQLAKQIHAVQTPVFFSQWSDRCFREQYLAYIKGRREQDPCQHYYEDQLRSFRRAIVPQTERYNRNSSNGGRTLMLLGTCDELTRQARQNLEEWERSGQMRVQELARAAKYEFGEKQTSS